MIFCGVSTAPAELVSTVQTIISHRVKQMRSFNKTVSGIPSSSAELLDIRLPQGTPLKLQVVLKYCLLYNSHKECEADSKKRILN